MVMSTTLLNILNFLSTVLHFQGLCTTHQSNSGKFSVTLKVYNGIQYWSANKPQHTTDSLKSFQNRLITISDSLNSTEIQNVKKL